MHAFVACRDAEKFGLENEGVIYTDRCIIFARFAGHLIIEFRVCETRTGHKFLHKIASDILHPTTIDSIPEVAKKPGLSIPEPDKPMKPKHASVFKVGQYYLHMFCHICEYCPSDLSRTITYHFFHLEVGFANRGLTLSTDRTPTSTRISSEMNEEDKPAMLARLGSTARQPTSYRARVSPA